MLTNFAKDLILGVSQGYEYASGKQKGKQNPSALSLIPQKISTAISANYFHIIFFSNSILCSHYFVVRHHKFTNSITINHKLNRLLITYLIDTCL